MFKRTLLIVVLIVAPLGCGTFAPKHAAPSVETAAAPGPSEIAAPKNLPMDAFRAVAAEIERQVAEGNREPKLGGPEGFVVDTPVVRQAVRTRAARIELVRTLLNTGNAWERRNGRIWILRSAAYKKSTSARQRDIDAIMVNGENRDRWALYEGLLDANKLGRGGLSAVEEIFFDARVQHMTAGQKFEASDGKQTAIAAAK